MILSNYCHLESNQIANQIFKIFYEHKIIFIYITKVEIRRFRDENVFVTLGFNTQYYPEMICRHFEKLTDLHNEECYREECGIPFKFVKIINLCGHGEGETAPKNIVTS